MNSEFIYQQRKKMSERWIEVTVFCVMIPYSNMVEYQRFGGPCCLHVQGDVTSPSTWGSKVGIPPRHHAVS